MDEAHLDRSIKRLAPRNKVYLANGKIIYNVVSITHQKGSKKATIFQGSGDQYEKGKDINLENLIRIGRE